MNHQRKNAMSLATTNLTAIFDWIEFTVLDMPVKDVIDTILALPFDDFTPLEKGRFGYQNQLKWNNGNVFVLFTSLDKEVTEDVRIKESMGVHVMLTGTGCRHYESDHKTLELLRRAYALERVNFSRIDVAIDDYCSKIISYDRINKSALAKTFTSRWSKWDEINSRETSSGDYIGRTMYFGSQVSEIFCRIYDKTLERKAKAEEGEEIPEAWTRLEIVYRKERAKKVVEHLIDHQLPIGYVLRGTLKHYLRFLSPSTDQNKSRWPSAKWWEALLSGVEAIQLTEKKDTKSIEQMKSWVEKQIAPTMAAILKAHDGDMEWLRQTIVEGSSRLKRHHRDAINVYQKGLTYE